MYQKKPKINLEVISKYSHSTHAPFKCKDCDYHTDRPAALNMHWNRKHGLTIVPNEELKRKSDAELIPNGFMLTTQEQAEVVSPKRKYNKRSIPQQQEFMQPFRQVQFCPCCGTDIAAVNLALATAASR